MSDTNPTSTDLLRQKVEELLSDPLLFPDDFYGWIKASMEIDPPNFLASQLPAVSGTVPTGGIIPFAGTVLPNGWLICDGSAIDRGSYAALFQTIGTLYGAGDGSTTFNLPDLRGRSIVSVGTNADVNTLGQTDGVAVANRRGLLHRHTPHSHITVIALQNMNGAGNVGPAGGQWNITNTNYPSNSVDGGSGVSTDPLDGGAYLVLNYMIKT